MNDRLAIGSIPLYLHLDRIDRGLATLGIGPADPIEPEQLFPLDQWHYHGTEAICAAADRLGIGPTSRVLEIGSGIGVPPAISRTPPAATSPRWNCNARSTPSPQT